MRRERYINSVEKMSSKMRTAVEAEKFKSYLGLDKVDDPKWFKVDSEIKSKADERRVRNLLIHIINY